MCVRERERMRIIPVCCCSSKTPLPYGRTTTYLKRRPVRAPYLTPHTTTVWLENGAHTYTYLRLACFYAPTYLRETRVQCDRIGQFFIFLVANFHSKEAQNILAIFGPIYITNPTFMKKRFNYFLGNIGKNWASFYTIIWSH